MTMKGCGSRDSKFFVLRAWFFVEEGCRLIGSLHLL